MEENNNNITNSQNPDSAEVGEGLQNAGQNIQERTYWEAQAANPNSEAPLPSLSDQPQTPLPPSQETPVVQAPDQFYTYYQQQMNGGSNNVQQFGTQQQGAQQFGAQQQGAQQFGAQQQGAQQFGSQQYGTQQYSQYSNAGQEYPPAYHAGRKQKKSHGKVLVAIIVALLLVGIGSATAFAFRDSLSNTFARLTKSPADYYEYIEKKSFQNFAENFVASDFKQEKAAAKITTDLSFHRDTLDSLLQSNFDFTLSDLEAMLGLSLNSIGLDMLVAAEDNMLNEAIGVRLNQVNLITAQMFMDMTNEDIFVRLPELSPAYLYQSLEDQNMEDVTPDTDLLVETLTPDRISDFLNRYSSILFDHLDQVEIKDNVVLKLDRLSTEASCITVTITEKDTYELCKAILAEAKEDDFLIDLMTGYSIPAFEYQQAILEAEEDLEYTFDSTSEEDPVLMDVYLDSKGYIIGRKLHTEDERDNALGYTILMEKDYSEYEFYFDEGSLRRLQVVGSQTKEDGSYDGSLTLEINDAYDFGSNLSFDLTYEDVRRETKGAHSYQYGTITLSSLELMGMQITLDCYTEDEVQWNKLTLQLGASPLVTMDIKTEFLDNYKMEMPPNDAEVYHFNQAETYLASINTDIYMERLSDQLGVDIESILSMLFPNMY